MSEEDALKILIEADTSDFDKTLKEVQERITRMRLVFISAVKFGVVIFLLILNIIMNFIFLVAVLVN